MPTAWAVLLLVTLVALVAALALLRRRQIPALVAPAPLPFTPKPRHPLDTWTAVLYAGEGSQIIDVRHGRGIPPPTLTRPSGTYAHTARDPHDPSILVYRRQP